MKKLILYLATLLGLVLILNYASYAQTKGKSVGGGTVWTDSLGYTNLDETSDSILVMNMNFSKGWIHIFVKGNATAQADSFYVQAGSVRYTQAKVATDTVWGSWAAFKDSAWTDTNIMINNTVGKDYLLFRPITQLLRFTLLNYRAAIPTRNMKLVGSK